MSMQNPYAAPSMPPVAKPGAGMGGPAPGTQPGQVWRYGNLLVMEKWATLPDICVKSNEPTNGQYLKRNMTWHPPVIFLLLLLNLILYAVVALIMQKRATIHVGLSPAWRNRRRLGIAISWLSVLTAIVLFIGGAMVAGPDMQAAGAILLISSPLVFLIGLVVGIRLSTVVSPKKITDALVILKGCHPDYLARFPDFPYMPVW